MMQTVLSSRSLLCAQAASSRQWLLASATQLQGSSCHFLPYTAEAYLGMLLWGHALCVWRTRESHVMAPIPENGQTCTTNAGLMPALGGTVVSIVAVALLDAINILGGCSSMPSSQGSLRTPWPKSGTWSRASSPNLRT